MAKTSGKLAIFIDEKPSLPSGVAQVETALPAFIGYTGKADNLAPHDLQNKPKRISSFIEYELYYGSGPSPNVTKVNIDNNNNFISAEVSYTFYMYDALRMFYSNGGGDCYILSIGKSDATTTVSAQTFIAGLAELEKEDGPTILLFPDAVTLSDRDIANVQQAALTQCNKLRDRVSIFDVKQNDALGTNFRNNIGTNNLKYGSVYSPWLKVSLPKSIKYPDIKSVIKRSGVSVSLSDLTNDPKIKKMIARLERAYIKGVKADIQTLEDSLASSFPVYKSILTGMGNSITVMPPSGAVAGVYAEVDRTRGVWKSPANVSLNNVLAPDTIFTTSQSDNLNVDAVAGKSINAIRFFMGKGTLVFGARTLAGNDNEWRYISVVRFLIMAEESCRKATKSFVFEPNDAKTWLHIQGMIENFLTMQWKQGALQGAKPEQAFYVAVGLGKTMTQTDILEGRLIIQIGLAVVRPAEFIILSFTHKMENSR